MLNPTIILASALREMNTKPSRYIKINDAGTGFVLVNIDELITEINNKGTIALNATEINGKTVIEFIEDLKTELHAHHHDNIDALNNITDDKIDEWNSKQDDLGYIPEDASKKGVANGYASLDNTGKIPLIQLPPVAKESIIVQSIEERDGLTNVYPGLQCLVIDIDAITAGQQSTLYVCKNVINSGLPTQYAEWVVVARLNQSEFILEWNNIIGRPNSTTDQIDDAVNKSHEHNNKKLIDKFTEESNKLLFDGKPLIVGVNAIGTLKNINLIASNDNTTELLVHGIDNFNKDKDIILDVFYNGVKLHNTDYTYTKSNGKIKLNDWSLFEGEFLNLEVELGTQ